MYEHIHGSIPDGMNICHKCDNPTCINPDHLFLGTRQENMRDRDRKGRGRTPKHENHPKAKLNWRLVNEIRASDLPNALLAKQFDVSKSTIIRVKTHKFWREPPNVLIG
jgi:hypothetical protein